MCATILDLISIFIPYFSHCTDVVNLSIELSSASSELFLHTHGPLVCFQKEKCTLPTKNIFSFYQEKRQIHGNNSYFI